MTSMTAWERIEIVRKKNRPTIRDYIPLIFSDFTELHGDRLYGDDGAILGGLARLDGRPVTVIAHVKGHNLEENRECNFAMAHPEGYRKALRLMKQAEKFHRPIICFIDTPGAFCGIQAEERGQGEAIARNLLEMMELKTPILSVVLGEGGSGGALALGVCDELAMLSNSVYSVISPRGFASILYKDPAREQEAAEKMCITAQDLMRLGVCDAVIQEPEGGAGEDVEAVAARLEEYLRKSLEKYLELGIDKLLKNRYDKFRKLGSYQE